MQQNRSHRLLPGTIVFALLLALLSPSAGRAAGLSDELNLKAAFIYNFAKYVEWPDDAPGSREEFCIGTLGRPQLDKALAALAGKSIRGRTVVVRRFNSEDEAGYCQILFIDRSALERFDDIAHALEGRHVMTVADREGFWSTGGMVTLVNQDDRITFDINYREIQRSGLKINSQLLKLARKIYGRPRD